MSKILGLSVSTSLLAYEKDNKIIEYRAEMADQFRAYAYGNDSQIGLNKILKKVDGDYSTDLDLILFFFKVNPAANEPQDRKDVDNYRPKEKSIAAWIIINEDNFFNKSPSERNTFVNNEIINRLEQIEKRFKNGKVNVDMDHLIKDTKLTLNKYNQ